MQAKLVQGCCGCAIDYTPNADVAVGTVVVQGVLVGVATSPIPANTQGALETGGVFDVVKVSGAVTAGANVYWKADGNPVGGTAGTGAATATSTDNTLIGKAIKAAASGDTTVRVKLLQ